MNQDYIFKTRAVNKDGMNGITYIENGIIVPLSPVNKKPRLGSNPEELIGMSYASCLNSTLIAILKSKRLTNETDVRVDVYFKRDLEDKDKRYFFQIDAFLEVKNMTLEEMTPYVNEAHYRCPVSQLLKDSKTVTVKPFIFED